jgi:nucleotide-binding universal stress UspA family protein
VRRILVASDLTAYTDRAFDRAAMLAGQNQATIRFLHAIDPSLLPERHIRRNIREAQALLEQEVRESGIGEQLDTSVKVIQGLADAIIVEEAKTMQADLIVMGLSHDASLTGMVRGTTADKVVRRAECPVLIVKTRARRPYAKIAVAVDLAEPSRRALDLSLRAFPDAEFNLVHVDEAKPGTVRAERRHQVEDMAAARLMAAGMRSKPTLAFGSGKAVTVLQEHIAMMDPDLVAMGTHGRTGVSSFFLGSVAETLLEALPRDVLVVRG